MRTLKGANWDILKGANFMSDVEKLLKGEIGRKYLLFEKARLYDEAFREITGEYDSSFILQDCASVWNKVYYGIAVTQPDLFAFKLANDEVEDLIHGYEKKIDEILKGGLAGDSSDEIVTE